MACAVAPTAAYSWITPIWVNSVRVRGGELAKRERINRAESSNARLIKLPIETDKPGWDRLIAEARRRWPDEFKASTD
jgi:hypothetical protein